MVCEYCQVKLPPDRPRFCSKRCGDRQYYRTHKERHRALGRAWIKRNPERRKATYTKYQREKAKLIYQRNKWRHAESYSRTASRRILLKLRPMRCVSRGKHSGRVECHHKDGNPFNRLPENLEWRCKKHHVAAHPRPAAVALDSSPRLARSTHRT